MDNNVEICLYSWTKQGPEVVGQGVRSFGLLE